MQYNRVFLKSFGYELPTTVISTAELEERLRPLYQRYRLQPGQLEALTGIRERRWWDRDFPLSEGATRAARKALKTAGMHANELDVVIYAGVCREQFEPATACRIADSLGVSDAAAVYDVSNACLGVLNGIIDVANRIELGQAQAGLVVSCETAREINESAIEHMLRAGSMDLFKSNIATLTGGSGAVAVLVCGPEFSDGRRRLLGGVTKTAPQHHTLCRWGLEQVTPILDRLMKTDAASIVKYGVQFGLKHCVYPFASTDAGAVLKYGVDLGLRTWGAFTQKIGWANDQIDKVICHQVGAGHRDAILKSLGIPTERDFSTFPFLGNIGTVSLPITAALAEERQFLQPGDRVGFLGIGSGLNCMMLGLEW